MSKRAVPKGQKARVATKTQQAVLEPVEDKVVRMRHGWALPDDEPLGRVGQDRPDVAQKLLEMEMRALEKSGRLARLRAEAGVMVEAGDNAKEKIISGLSAKLKAKKKR